MDGKSLDVPESFSPFRERNSKYGLRIDFTAPHYPQFYYGYEL
jgi:hypothetical protein